MKKLVFAFALLGLAALAWPAAKPAIAQTPAAKPDLANGQTIFTIGGCAACHMTPGQTDRTKLGGGDALTTAFGTFYAPNISPDPVNGIGNWSEAEFVNAVMHGVGKNAENLYPALPYTSYAHMRVRDVQDLYAYLKTLPAVAVPNKPHKIGFPFNIRFLLTFWKWLYLDTTPIAADPAKSAAWNRGRYLVEGPGHCAECHSPRNFLGGIVSGQRFAGGMDPEGKSWVPNITQHADGIAGWKKDEIADFLSSGLTPSADSVGGSMAEVIQNTSRLTDPDRAAMAEYLVTLPAKPGKAPAKKP